MKIWWRIIIAAIILGLLVLRLGYKIYRKEKDRSDEKRWYAENLRYDFTAVVDTIIMRNGDNVGFGTVIADVVQGQYNPAVEDSLNDHLKLFASLRLNESKKEDRIRFLFRDAGSYAAGDTFRVISANDQILFLRRPQVFYSIHSVLEGRLRKNDD